MDSTVRGSFLPHNDPAASPAFDCDTRSFEVHYDVGCDGMRWITVRPADLPGTSIVLKPCGADLCCRLSISRLAVRLNTTVDTGSM